MYRIYYNWYHENAAIGFEYDTKTVEAETMEKVVEILSLIKVMPNKYELLSVERI